MRLAKWQPTAQIWSREMGKEEKRGFKYILSLEDVEYLLGAIYETMEIEEGK